jgi:hypothetical protein
MEITGNFIRISKDQLTHLNAEFRRAGYTAKRLLANRQDIPDGLDVRLIQRWLNGWAKEASVLHLTYIQNLLAVMPDYDRLSKEEAKSLRPYARTKPDAGQWVDLTAEMLTHLSSELIRTGASVPELLRSPQTAPVGLTAGIIACWRSGRTATVNPEFWVFVVDRLAQLPDRLPVPPKLPRTFPKRHLQDYRRITVEECAELQRQRTRTGLGGVRLMKQATDRPAGLSGANVQSWLNQQTASASPEHLEFVLNLYRSQPDAK